VKEIKLPDLKYCSSWLFVGVDKRFQGNSVVVS